MGLHIGFRVLGLYIVGLCGFTYWVLGFKVYISYGCVGLHIGFRV